MFFFIKTFNNLVHLASQITYHTINIRKGLMQGCVPSNSSAPGNYNLKNVDTVFNQVFKYFEQ